MCTTRSWNSLIPVVDKIVATRSDGVVFQIPIGRNTQFTRIFLSILSTYKDCKCSAEALCPKHQTNMEKTNAR